MTVFVDHVDQLPCLIRNDLPASILEVEPVWLPGAGIRSMRSACIPSGDESKQFGDFARVLKSNIARVVPYAGNELRTLRQSMIPYVISISEKLTIVVFKYHKSKNLVVTVARMFTPSTGSC